jgi:hypothetical protein
MARDPSKLRSFLLGGIVGGVVALAAERVARRKGADRRPPPGLAAFERAPCFEELREREQRPTPSA